MITYKFTVSTTLRQTLDRNMTLSDAKAKKTLISLILLKWSHCVMEGAMSPAKFP